MHVGRSARCETPRRAGDAMSWTDLQQGVLEAFVDAGERGDILDFYQLPAGVSIVNDGLYHGGSAFEARVIEAASARCMWCSRTLAALVGCSTIVIGRILQRAGWRARSNGRVREYVNERAIVRWAGTQAHVWLNAPALLPLPGVAPRTAARALAAAGWTRRRTTRANYWIKPRRALAKTVAL